MPLPGPTPPTLLDTTDTPTSPVATLPEASLVSQGISVLYIVRDKIAPVTVTTAEPLQVRDVAIAPIIV